jgi:hypothetical protein
MSGTNTAVFGIYPTDGSADEAAGTLRTMGFRSTDVSRLAPLVATLAGSRAGGNMGDATGVLIGLGMSAYQEMRYEGRMRRGGVLLSVQADDRDWASKGKQILEQTGAEDISWNADTEWECGNTVRAAAVSSISRR